MITHPFLYLLLISAMAVLALFLSRKEYSVLKYIPPIVLLYMSVMLLSSAGLFEKNDAITQSYTTLKSNLLPAMLFLMLLPNKVTVLFRLGGKMILAFFLASGSLFFAFLLSFMLFSQQASDIEILGPLAGSWMGGTGNMLAVAAAIDASENAVGITMLIDSVDYSLWVMFLLLLVPLASSFNRFTKASDPVKDVDYEQRCALHFSTRGYIWLLLSALLVSLFSQLGGIVLSQLFGSATTWSVIIATLFGIAFSFTSLAEIKGLQSTANTMLYLFIVFIASRADICFDFSFLSYLFMGLSVLSIHALLMLLFAKLFRLDLFTVSVASLANVGGIASAPILSAAYAQSLVGIGVLMATLGYIIGTFGALLLTQVLRWIA
jgi:uncharacterized membrane protein